MILCWYINTKHLVSLTRIAGRVQKIQNYSLCCHAFTQGLLNTEVSDVLPITLSLAIMSLWNIATCMQSTTEKILLFSFSLQNQRSGADYHATFATTGYGKKCGTCSMYDTHNNTQYIWQLILTKKKNQHHHCLVDNVKWPSKNIIFQAIRWSWNLILNPLLHLVYWHSVGSSTVVTVTRICQYIGVN